MEDVRTGPLPSSNSGQLSSSRSHGRRRERHFTTSDAASTDSPTQVEADARSYGIMGSVSGSRRSKSGLRALQELVSDARTINCETGSELPSRLPQPLVQRLPLPKHKHQQRTPILMANHSEDFAKYLGLPDAGSTDNGQRSRRHRSTHNQPSIDRLSSADGDSGPESHAASRRRQSRQQQSLPSVASLPPQHPGSDGDFADEEKLCQLVGSMLDQAARVDDQSRQQQHLRQRPNSWDAEAIAASMYPFVSEFSDRIFRLQSRAAFPFNQAEMLEMSNLLAGNFSSVKDSELLLRQCISDLRSIHLQMRLFLHTDATLVEVDDAELFSLLMTFAEQVDRDLCSASAGSSSGHFPNFSKYARRRATTLAAVVGRYAQTAERRRRLALGRMQNLATTVMGFVACCPSEGVGDGGLRKAVVALFDDMIACFACLGSVGAGTVGSGNSNSGSRISRPASPTAAADGFHSEDDECYSGFGSGDTPSRLPPPPPSLMETHNEPAASIEPASENEGVDCCNDNLCDQDWAVQGVEALEDSNAEGAVGLATDCSIEPDEALSLQFMERLEGLLTSFLPNERVNNPEFKKTFNALFEWWRRASTNCTNRSWERRMMVIREKFDRAQKLRIESNGVKRLYSESETTWDLIEVAKLMVSSEERTVFLAETQMAAECREAALSLVDSTLATLYLYQLAQDASVLSTRLRTDFQRLINRLTDCGPVPMLFLLRLRLEYLRARQYSDLLRAHPQGCLLLELTQVHRVLNRDAYPDGLITSPLNLTICVPLNDYKKFCQHVKDMHVLSFEARAPVTEQTSMLMKTSCLRKIEKCCQCSIDILPPGSSGATSDTATCGATASSPSTGAIAFSSAETALTSSSRRKSQLIVGGMRPIFGLVVRPDPSHGRANAAMRMICDIVGPASIRDRVKYSNFHLSVLLPHNYKPLTIFAETSRPLAC